MTSIKYILGLSCILGFTSCQQEELTSDFSVDERIMFGAPFLSVESRSKFHNTLPDKSSFGVLGYCVPYKVGSDTEKDYIAGTQAWGFKMDNCPPEVFYKQKVNINNGICTYDGENGNGNNPKYWYKDSHGLNNEEIPEVSNAEEYNYSFFAYYPYEGAFKITAPTSSSVKGAPEMTFTMPQETPENVNEAFDHTKTPDAMLSVLYNRKKKDGNLQFYFSHVLTGLGFEVNNFSEKELVIHSLKLRGKFYKKIKIDFTNNEMVFTFPLDRYEGFYDLYSGEDMVLSPPKEGETATSSPSPLGGEHILLISGEEPYFGQDVTVELEYTFGGRKDTFKGTRPTSFVPRPGVKYTAQLNFVGDTFVLQFVVDNEGIWEDGEAADGDIGNDDIIFE